MKKRVKAIFNTEIYYLYYLNNKLIETFTEYQDVLYYCIDNNLDLVQSKGL